MPRKPFDKQASWQVTAHGRNFTRTYHRIMIRIALGGLPKRYEALRLGVVRNPHKEPLIHNGKKAR